MFSIVRSGKVTELLFQAEVSSVVLVRNPNVACRNFIVELVEGNLYTL